jgi:hypothetical protein
MGGWKMRKPETPRRVSAESQLWLPFADVVSDDAPRALRDALGVARRRLYPRRDVAVRYAAGESVLVSVWREASGRVIIQAQDCFRDAPPKVAEAVLRMNLGRIDRPTRRRFSHLIHAWHLLEAPPARSWPASKLKPGRHHDLAAILAGVRARHCPELGEMDISLAARTSRTTMGRHERRAPRSLILINPLLDHAAVEPWYLDFLVFHECLHELVPPRCRNGRIERHPRELRQRERTHPDYPKVRNYERWLTGEGHAVLRRAWRRRNRRKR